MYILTMCTCNRFLLAFLYFHFGFHYSTSTCGADKRTVAVVMTVKVVKVMRQNLEIFTLANGESFIFENDS